MNLISWNVNGIRACIRKGFFDVMRELDADILCLQESKAQDDQVMKALEPIKDEFYIYCNSAVKKGYSGTVIISKTEPLNVTYDIGVEEHDTEGRVVTAEYDDFFIVNVYVPNSGSELKRLDYRQTWDEAFRAHFDALQAQKPVIVCGDLNVAHQPIDIARPDANYNESSGYCQPEIDGLTAHLEAGFVDTFREIYPDKVEYSWWSWRGNARANNVGWRIDYFLVSEPLMEVVEDAFILPEVEGSDHCPVGVILAL